MPNFTAQDVKKLREATGAGMMDCKKALDEADGDFEKAKEIVRKRGLAIAKKKADREAKEGYIASYVHATNKIGAMVELSCETDFVARNQEFQELANNIALQVVAMSPATVDELFHQEFVKDPGVTIGYLLDSLSGKIGEKFEIKRFVRYQVGE